MYNWCTYFKQLMNNKSMNILSFLNVFIMFILIEINMINSPYIALRENWLIFQDYN